MDRFRNKNPQTTSDNDAFDKYGLYKEVLMTDFYNKCGYCDDNDFWMGGWRGMQIDHFAPKKPFTELENTYENLVYSCFYCNNAKSNDWVTDSYEQPINDEGTEGYIHPRENTYNDLFRRSSTGSIIPQTDVGLYMYTFMNLGLKRHELICTMERVIEIVGKINSLLVSNIISDEVKNTLIDNKNTLLSHKDNIERQFRTIISAR